MRCPTEFIRAMNLPLSDNLFAHKFAKLDHPVKVRVVKIQFSDGTIEHLITNLFEPDITLDDFKWLYGKRWSIESKYNDVKNKLEIENFTGYSPDTVLQDVYATLFLATLAGALEYDLHEEIEAAHSSPENKYAYKMNVSMTISELKRTVVEMLVATSFIKRERLFLHITKRLKNAVVPVHPNRSFSREKSINPLNTCKTENMFNLFCEYLS